MYFKLPGHIKGPFRDPQPHPPILQKSWDYYISRSKPLGTSLGSKYFLQIHLFGAIICKIVYLLCRHNYQHNVLCSSTILENMHNWQTQPQNLLKIWKYKLILSVSTNLYHKSDMLGLQNRPLKVLRVCTWNVTFP